MVRELMLGQLTRKTVCEKADILRAYGVSETPSAVKNRRKAIESTILDWHNGRFGNAFLTVRDCYDVADYEGSEVLRDLIATDLAMQLDRMGQYIQKNGYRVELGEPVCVTLYGDNDDVSYIRGNVDMVLVDETKREETAVKIVSKQTYSDKARTPANLPENSPEIAFLSLSGSGRKGALFSLSHKDDKSSFFAEEYDIAVSVKTGKVLTGKCIASALMDEETAKRVLAASLKEAEECPDCSSCGCMELCKGNFTFRERAAEAEVSNKTFLWSAEQEAVISHKEGNLAVLAGPGSGKTAVLVERYVQLVKSGVMPQNILMLVFTNKATDEIRQRIATRLNLDRNERKTLNVMTINAFGQMLLNENPSAFGGRMVVADSGERKRMIREILFPAEEDGSGLMTLRHRYRNLYGDFCGLSDLNRLLEKIDLGADAETLKLSDEDFAEAVRVNEELHRRLNAMNAITYDKQVLLPLIWLQHDSRMCGAYANIYRYIMVDEAQDLDEQQYQLVRLLAKNRNLVMVGDDDQSIYRFRKGSSRFLLAFAKEKDTKVVVLRDNFRASELLNGVANGLISKSVEERRRKAYRYANKGRRPEYALSHGALPEVVSSLLRSGTKPCDIAILARTNKTLEGVSATLTGIVDCSNSKDYVREDAVFLFIRSAIDLALHGSDAEKMSLYRFCKGFGDVPIGPLSKLPEELGRKIGALKTDLLLYPVEDAIEAFIADEVPEIRTNHPILGMIREWAETKDLDVESLFDFMSQMIRFTDDTRIDYGADADKVQLFTAHDSKGKEFPVVIVCDADAYEDEDGSSEELRLLYVAMTRAKERLVVIGKEECDSAYFTYLIERCVPFNKDEKDENRKEAL